MTRTVETRRCLPLRARRDARRDARREQRGIVQRAGHHPERAAQGMLRANVAEAERIGTRPEGREWRHRTRWARPDDDQVVADAQNADAATWAGAWGWMP